MSRPNFTVGSYLEERLEEIEIKMIFGHSGCNLNSWFQIIEKNENIKLVTTSNEQEAAFSADSFSKFNKKPCCISVNHGSSNLKLLNSISGSLLSKLSIVIICISPSLKKMNDVNSNVNLFSKVTKKSVRLIDGFCSPTLIDEVLTECISNNSPVYLEIPEDILVQKCEEPKGLIQIKKVKSDQFKVAKSISKFEEILPNYKFPIILVGNEVVQFQLQELFIKLVVKFKLPYISTISSKSLISESNAYFEGVYLGNNSNWFLKELIECSDLIIMIGVSNFEISELSIKMDLIEMKQTIILHENIIQIGSNFLESLVTLEDFMKGLLKYEFKNFPKFNHKIQVKEKKELENLNVHITYDNIIELFVASKILNENSVILGDSSLSIFPLAEVVVNENQFISQISWSSFGYSLGASIGIQLSKKRPLIFIGDGGFQESVRSLSTLKKLKSNAIIFLFNNGTFGLEQWSENANAFKENGKYDVHNIISKWNYFQLMNSIDGKAFNISTLKELKDSFEKIENMKEISLLILNLNPKDLPLQVKWKIE
eukprot:gene11938-5339_t